VSATNFAGSPAARVAAGGPAVRIEQLTRRFGQTVALDRVDLEVPSGQMRALRCQVGFIFQQFGLVGRLTVLENVLSGALGRIRFPRFGVLAYPRSLRLEALSHLERVGLDDRAFQRSDTLSGGQQQRVAIARTLMQQPVLLLADEPVASLDPESSAAVMELLLRICQEEHLTVIASLHQVELARGWADRMVGLRDGRVVLDTRPQDITSDELMEIYRGRRADADDGSPSLGSPATAAPATQQLPY
jgi:phosphonate transport system ATP-binding protein